MSTKGKLTRSAAIDKAGLDLVIAAESDNCEPTNRCGYNGSCQDDALIEWRGSASGADTAGEDITVEVYYYTDEDQEAAAKASGWDCISWDIAGYEITD